MMLEFTSSALDSATINNALILNFEDFDFWIKVIFMKHCLIDSLRHINFEV